MLKNFFRSFSGLGITKSVIGNLIFNAFIWFLKFFKIFGRVKENKIFLGSLGGFELYFLEDKHPFESEVLKGQIKKGDVVLDIGAYVGYYTMLASKIVGDEGKIFAFEPDPENFKNLEINIKKNNCHNVELVKAAVCDKTGSMKLYLNKSDRSENTLYGSNIEDSITVKTIKPDDYFKNRDNRVNFIKIDIEGAERRAFEGMEFILEKNRQIKIFTEINPRALENSGFSAKDYVQLLIGMGFSLYKINESQKKVEIISVDSLVESFSDNSYINILCAR